jgi:hypothetical protein
VTEARGIPLGAVAAGANRHDAPLLGPTLATLDRLVPLPDQPDVLNHHPRILSAVGKIAQPVCHRQRVVLGGRMCLALADGLRYRTQLG